MRPVRSILAALLFLSLPLVAAESPTETTASGTVVIDLDESIEVHRSLEDLQRLCRARWHVEGCTDFPEETLQCHCEWRGEEWLVSATARIRAVMHLPASIDGARIRAHEKLHLADVQDSLRTYLESVASLAFESGEDCEAYARFLSTSTYFRSVMNEIREKSNAKYGCGSGGKMQFREK